MPEVKMCRSDLKRGFAYVRLPDASTARILLDRHGRWTSYLRGVTVGIGSSTPEGAVRDINLALAEERDDYTVMLAPL